MIGEELLEVSVSKITANTHQPRGEFDAEELQDLAQSIRSVGLLHPPLVRRIHGTDRFELISGERRYRAAKLAGLEKIPVIVRESSECLSAQAALVENIQRVDLNPLEIAKAMKSLMQEFGLSQDALADRVGKKRSTVANYLRLLGLSKKIQDRLRDGQITMGHAKAILSVDDASKQELLCDLVIVDELSVRETEEAAAKISIKAKAAPKIRDIHFEQLAEKIQYKLGTKVSIQGRGKAGRISINYYSLDDLDRLLQIFGVD